MEGLQLSFNDICSMMVVAKTNGELVNPWNYHEKAFRMQRLIASPRVQVQDSTDIQRHKVSPGVSFCRS